MSRPRSAEVDSRIVEAAARILREQGYDALSISAVAKAAGVGKPSIYRRFATRAELAFAATVESSLTSGVPDAGSFTEDMRIAIQELVRTLKLAPRHVLGDQIGRAMADAAFSARLRAAQLDPSITRMLVVWERGVGRGEVDGRLDGRRALRDLASAVIMRVLLYHEAMEEPEQRETLQRFVRSVMP